MKNCRKCGKPIDFMPTARGSYMPVNKTPVWIVPKEHGTVAVMTNLGRLVRGEQCAPHEAGGIMGYIPHFSTCRGEAAKREARREARELRQELGEPTRRPAKRKQAAGAEQPPEAELIPLF